MSVTTKKALVPLALFAVWLAFAFWQYHEFEHFRQREQADLIGQSDVLRQALIGGARARRRLGRVFEEQMQAVLDEIAATPGVVAVFVDDDHGWVSIGAGETQLLTQSTESPLWSPHGLQTSEISELNFLPPGQGPSSREPGWMRDMNSEGSPSQIRLTLLMDCSTMNAVIRSAAQLRITVVLAGAAVLAAVGFAYGATIRAIQARAQAETLRMETERLEELSQAASGLAHETRNPLGVIRGGLQKMLRNGGGGHSDGERSRLNLLVEECDRVTSRINQFLAYARPQSAELDQVNLVPILRELQALMEPELEAKQLSLQLPAESDCEAIIADASLLRQMLFNLLQNAIAFSPPGKPIEVHFVKRHADGAELRVSDRGPGVAKDHVGRLFSPYFTTRVDGAGLGLAIVKRLAKEQGWSVHYEDQTNGGAVFTIEGIRVASKSPNLSR